MRYPHQQRRHDPPRHHQGHHQETHRQSDDPDDGEPGDFIAGSKPGHHRQGDEPDDVVSHRGAEHRPRFRCGEGTEVTENTGGYPDRCGHESGADEKRRVGVIPSGQEHTGSAGKWNDDPDDRYPHRGPAHLAQLAQVELGPHLEE